MPERLAGVLADIRLVFGHDNPEESPVTLDITEKDMLTIAKSLQFLVAAIDANIELWENFEKITNSIDQDMDLSDALKVIQPILRELR